MLNPTLQTVKPCTPANLVISGSLEPRVRWYDAGHCAVRVGRPGSQTGDCLLAQALGEQARADLCTSKLPSRSLVVGHHGEAPPPGAQRWRNLPLRGEPEREFALTEILKIAPLPCAAQQRSG
jgi:hypothetical protein